MHWKNIKRVRNGEQARDEMVKDMNGRILQYGVDVRKRWAEYFVSRYWMWKMSVMSVKRITDVTAERVVEEQR